LVKVSSRQHILLTDIAHWQVGSCCSTDKDPEARYFDSQAIGVVAAQLILGLAMVKDTEKILLDPDMPNSTLKSFITASATSTVKQLSNVILLIERYLYVSNYAAAQLH